MVADGPRAGRRTRGRADADVLARMSFCQKLPLALLSLVHTTLDIFVGRLKGRILGRLEHVARPGAFPRTNELAVLLL